MNKAAHRALLSIAEKNAGKMKFGWMDKNKYEKFLVPKEAEGVLGGQPSGVVLLADDEGVHYNHVLLKYDKEGNEMKSIDEISTDYESVMQSFVNDVLAGKLERKGGGLVMSAKKAMKNMAEWIEKNVEENPMMIFGIFTLIFVFLILSIFYFDDGDLTDPKSEFGQRVLRKYPDKKEGEGEKEEDEATAELNKKKSGKAE